MRRTRQCRPGFTLIELLVVIAIIGVLIGLLLPAVQKVREAANRTTCKNNMKQIGLAFHAYHDTYGTFTVGDTQTFWAWSVLLLPYIEQGNLLQQLNPSTNTFQSAVAATSPLLPLLQTNIKTYTCPSDGGPNPNTNDPLPYANGTAGPFIGTTNYVANAGADANNNTGMFSSACSGTCSPYVPLGLADIPDGSSNTFLVGERASTAVLSGANQGVTSATPVAPCSPIQPVTRKAGVWGGYQGWTPAPPSGTPETIWGTLGSLLYQLNTGDSFTGCTDNFPSVTYSSNHPGGVQFVFCDGSVQFIQNSINWTYLNQKDANGNAVPIGTINRLTERADGLPIGNY